MYDLNSEFYRVESGGLFLNSSFGIGPEFARSGAGGPSPFWVKADDLLAAMNTTDDGARAKRGFLIVGRAPK